MSLNETVSGERAMTAGAKYGVLQGVLLVALDKLNSPIAWAAYWTTQAILLTVFTKLIWQRTGLFWMTLAGADATLFSAALVPASLAGYNLINVPAPWLEIFWIGAFAVPLCFGIATVVHREQFHRWKQHTQPMSLRDMLLFRHIPYLR